MSANVSFNSDPFSLAKHFRIFGNVDLDQAEVVCVIDDPLDRSIRWSNVDLISQIWNDHILLVGFVPKGAIIQSVNHELTWGLEQVKEIKGWDLEKVILLKSHFDEEYKTICQLEKGLIRDDLDIELQISVGKNSALNKLLRRVIFIKIERKNVRQELLTFSTNGHSAIVKKRLQFWIDRAKRNYDRTCVEKYAEIFRSRQASLKEAIETELEENQKLREKKVIVLLERHQVLDPEMSGFLLTKKCVAISSKKLPEVFPEDQVERWGGREIPSSQEIKMREEPVIFSPVNEMQNRLNEIFPVAAPAKGLFRTNTFHDLFRLSPEETETE